MQTTILICTLMMTSAAGVNFDSSYKAKTDERVYFRVLTVTNGGPWGTELHRSWCPAGTYAKGYSQKIEPNQGGKDDTSLNNIALLCAKRGSTSYSSITVSPKPGFGEWTDPIICEGADTFMTSFILNVEQPTNGDDTAANYAKFRCRKFDGTKERTIDCKTEDTYGYYGKWSDSCPSGSAICGMKTKTEPGQGSGDDTYLNDVVFYCCDPKINSWSQLGDVS